MQTTPERGMVRVTWPSFEFFLPQSYLWKSKTRHQWPWMTLKVTFVVWNLYNSFTSGNVAHCLWHVYAWIGKRMYLVISTVLLKLKDFSRLQAVVNTVKVVLYRKQCDIETLLLQTLNRKRYVVYKIAAIPMTLSDHQCHSLIASLFKWDFSYIVVQHLTRFQLTCTLCSPSAIA